MSYETELGNVVHPTNIISDAITPALVQRVVFAPLIRYEPMPANTAVKLFRKDGSLSASEVSESNTLSAASGHELTQTSVTATAVKLASMCILTVEGARFGQVTGADIAKYLGEAIGRDWDDEILALNSGFSNQVTCTSVLTVNDVLQAAYYVRSGTAGVSSGRLTSVFDYKGINEIQKELTNSAAAHLSIPTEISLLAGVTGANGRVGEKAGIDFYQTDGSPAGAGSTDVALVFDGNLSHGAMVDPTITYAEKWLGAGDGTRGFATEYTAYFFCDIIEWNDAAGCGVLSAT